MKTTHWFTMARIRLFQKLGRSLLSHSASSISGSDQFICASFDPGLQFVGEDSTADFLIYSEGFVPKPSLLYKSCKPGGVVFVNFENRQGCHKSIEDLVAKFEGSGFEIHSILYYGFFSRILTFPLRISGFRLNPDKKIGRLRSRFWGALFSIELRLIPYVRFITGERILLIARHLVPERAAKHDLSVVIPAYNEEKRIPLFLQSVLKYIKKEKLDAEILVVNDGSKDNTAAVCENIDPMISVISLYRNFGKGAAIREGIFASHGNYILISDADGSTPIQELPRLMAWTDKGWDIAIGSRYLSESNIIRKQSAGRRLISRLGNLLIRLVVGLPYSDTQCGFKLFARTPALFLFKDLKNNRFGFDFEILKKAKSQDFTVKEIPVEWSDVEGSKVTPRETIRVLWDLLYLQFGQLFFFGIAGILNTIIDYTVHNSLIFLLGMGTTLTQAYYQIVGFISANLFSYLFNSGFTFRRHGSYWKFFLVSFIALVFSTLSFYGLNVIFNPGNDLYLANFLKISTVIISFITNYFGYKLIVFRN